MGLKVFTFFYGNEHPTNANLLNNLGNCYLATKNYDLAE